MGKIIFGAILIVLQILSYLGSAYAGQLNFFTSCSAFEVVYFLSYNLVGIVGLVLVVLGVIAKTKSKNKEDT